jgi:hypothetical protein
MATHRPIPPAVWLALIALSVIGADLLVMGFAQDDLPQMLAGAYCGILIWGLVLAHRWAHVLTLITIAAAPLSLVYSGMMIEAVIATAILAFVAVPLIVDATWFWRLTPRASA